MNGWKIDTAVWEQANEIIEIYHSLLGTSGCTWNENYPTIEDVEQDIRNGSLYIVLVDGKIAAAAAMETDSEFDQLTCWSAEIRRPCTLGRVGVRPEYQRRGIAKELIRNIERNAVNCGFDGIHFLVGKRNFGALALYKKLGYQCCGDTVRYDIDWYCYEKRLTECRDEQPDICC